MFRADSWALLSTAFYSLLVLIALLSAPPKDLAERNRPGLALIFLGSVIAYLAGGPGTFLVGWALTMVPSWLDRDPDRASPRVILLFSTLALAAGFGLPGIVQGDAGRLIGFAAIALAALMRKGIFPFHFWVISEFEKGSLARTSLLLNSHLGAYVLIRFGIPMFPELGARSLPLIGGLAIFTAVYAAVRALAATRPRRVLSLLFLSQVSFILAGLENRNVEGITGALVHWWAVGLATAVMFGAYRALEVRTTEVESPRGFLGLGYHAPRFAVFFSISVLALVGLPGTLGFAAEDLLFHGALESHPLLGIGLPLATALNAITALRLISTLFWGRRGLNVPLIPDAQLRERLALAFPVLFLVVAGLFPGFLIALRNPSAEWLVQVLCEPLDWMR